MLWEIELFKNHDPAQAIEFRARSKSKVLDKVRRWLNQQTGEAGSKGAGADGVLICMFHGVYGISGISLQWDQCYKNWEITDDETPADSESFDRWDDARDAFMVYVEAFAL